MLNLTVGQIIGVQPLYSTIPTRHQYKSKLNGMWYNCHEHELSKYKKYYYEVRTIFN